MTCYAFAGNRALFKQLPHSLALVDDLQKSSSSPAKVAVMHTLNMSTLHMMAWCPQNLYVWPCQPDGLPSQMHGLFTFVRQFLLGIHCASDSHAVTHDNRPMKLIAFSHTPVLHDTCSKHVHPGLAQAAFMLAEHAQNWPTGAPQVEGHFFNYFSVGLDAQAAYGFHHLRETKPWAAPSRLINQAWYAYFSCSSGWFCGAPSLNTTATLEVGPACECLVIVAPLLLRHHAQLLLL